MINTRVAGLSNYLFMERNSTDELIIYDDGEIDHLKLKMRLGRPLGWAELEATGTLAGTLGELGAERIGRRYPVFFGNDARTEVIHTLASRVSRSPYFDRAVPLLNPSDAVGRPLPGFVLLATRAQMHVLPPCLARQTIVLGNGHLVQTVGLDGTPESTLEYQGTEYVPEYAPTKQKEELLLVTTPSTLFADRTGSRHSYCCILNPVHAEQMNSQYLYVRNPFLHEDFPEFRTAIPVRVIFDDRAPAPKVVLDSTTLFAIGLPQGEPAVLGRCRGRASEIRNLLFGHRHAVARVGRTAVIDIEKPVTRLPEEMLDLLGVSAGDRVIVEAAGHRHGYLEVARTTLRALPWRERAPLLVARSEVGVPNNQQLVGDEDFPQISLDLNARRRLGVVPGSAVYVRPAVSSLLGKEFTTVSFVLIAAIFSAAALQSLTLAIISATVYLILTTLIVGARLR